jgi:5'-nucleotidase
VRILVTNDDGIHAPGLAVAEKIARAISDDVWVIAPETEQSGASHSLTLASPLRLRAIDARHFAVSGTPTDCVLMGARQLLKDNPPDLVLSGVNIGSNVGDDVTYSGTIAGAMEGTSLGIPSIALSQEVGESRADVDWSVAETHGPGVVQKLLGLGWPPGTLINVNFPGCPAEQCAGMAMAAQGHYDLQSTNIIERMDTRERPYYWIGLRRRNADCDQNCDMGALQARKIAVTPLHLNLTEYGVLEKMRAALKS